MKSLIFVKMTLFWHASRDFNNIFAAYANHAHYDYTNN